MRPWRRRHPVTAGLLVGLVAYVFFAFTLTAFGDAEPEQAFGPTTVLGAATMWFIAWAVFSRSDPEPDRPGPDAPDTAPSDDPGPR